MESNTVLFGAGFIVVGVLLILFGIKKLMRCSGRAIGKITGIRETEESDNEGFKYYSYSPEFEFEADGQIYKGVGNNAYSKSKKIHIGGAIKVYFDPKDPHKHYTKGGGAILPFLGIMFIIVGFICMFTA